MPSIDLTIQVTDISIGPDTSVVITSPTLLNALVQAPTATLETLTSQVGPVALDAISVDSEGRVVVADPNFATALREGAKSSMTTNDVNYKCNTGCVQL